MDFIAKIPANLPEIIENNSEEVKAWLAEKMQKYEGIVVTAETIKAAKDDKAALNKLRTALENRRKEVKRDYLAPYMRFEEKYKELLALIDVPIAQIDAQVKALDEQEKQAKYNRLVKYFDDCVYGADPNTIRTILFDKILNPKWANKTMKEDTLEAEICASVTRIFGEYAELEKLYKDNPCLPAIIERYSLAYSKADAMAYAEQLRQKQLSDEELARKARQDAEAAEEFNRRREAAMQALAAQEATQGNDTAAHAVTPTKPTQALVRGCFRVEGTREQIIMLRDFLRNNGIKFEIVKEK